MTYNMVNRSTDRVCEKQGASGAPPPHTGRNSVLYIFNMITQIVSSSSVLTPALICGLIISNFKAASRPAMRIFQFHLGFD